MGAYHQYELLTAAYPVAAQDLENALLAEGGTTVWDSGSIRPVGTRQTDNPGIADFTREQELPSASEAGRTGTLAHQALIRIWNNWFLQHNPRFFDLITSADTLQRANGSTSPPELEALSDLYVQTLSLNKQFLPAKAQRRQRLLRALGAELLKPFLTADYGIVIPEVRGPQCRLDGVALPQEFNDQAVLRDMALKAGMHPTLDQLAFALSMHPDILELRPVPVTFIEIKLHLTDRGNTRGDLKSLAGACAWAEQQPTGWYDPSYVLVQLTSHGTEPLYCKPAELRTLMPAIQPSLLYGSHLFADIDS